MAPPLETWPAEELPERVLVNAHGKSRKAKIDLKDCELLQLLQYDCAVRRPQDRDAPVVCRPFQRLFRKCSDRAGEFMVETTAWEGTQGRATEASAMNEKSWIDSVKEKTAWS